MLTTTATDAQSAFELSNPVLTNRSTDKLFDLKGFSGSAELFVRRAQDLHRPSQTEKRLFSIV